MAKILLVEDDNNLREIYGARLNAEGYEIISAADGEEALAIAVKEKPDLIITDIMMPKVSGFDMLDILRNAPETKDTKIIMMTALSQAEDKDRADKLGADLYLVKSQVTLEDVVSSVQKTLDDKTSSDNPSPDPAAEPVTTPAPAPAVQTPAPAPAAPPVAEEPKPVADVPTPTAPTPPVPDPVAPAPAPQPDPAAEPVTPVPADSKVEEPQAVAKKIEVVSPPDSENKDESSVQDKPTEEIPVPAEPSLDETEPTPIGPNLAEALANEEKSTPIDNETVEKPAELLIETENENETKPEPEPEANTGTAPEPEKPEQPDTPETDASPSTVIKPASSADDDTSSTDQSDESDNSGSAAAIAGKKVIEPINDPTLKPDLDALLAKEEQKEIADKLNGPESPTI